MIDWKALLKSKTVWSGAVALAATGAAMTGHNIDPGTRDQLVTNLTNLADAIASIASLCAIVFRAKATTDITPAAGSTGTLTPNPQPPTT